MNPTDLYEQIKDIKRLNPVELEAMVLKHEQQIKDLAAHLLELRQLVTPMMEFKQPTKICGPNLVGMLNAAGFYKKKEWVGLTDEEIDELACAMVKGNKSVNWLCRAIEAKLRSKNNG